MKSYITYLLLICAANFSGNTQAAIALTGECNTCISTESYHIAAKEIAAGAPDVDVHVFNIDQQVMRRFAVAKYRDRFTGDFGPYQVSEKTVDSEKYALFEDLIAAKSNLEYAFRLHKDIPAEVMASAFDLPGNNSATTTVANYYLQNQSVFEAIGDYTSALLTLAGKVINANFVIEVHFADGTIAFLQITGIDANGNLQLTFKSGIDTDNNIIHGNTKSLSGTYNYTNSGTYGLSHFIRSLEQMGVQVTTDFDMGDPSATGSVVEVRLICDKNNACVFKKVE